MGVGIAGNKGELRDHKRVGVGITGELHDSMTVRESALCFLFLPFDLCVQVLQITQHGEYYLIAL